MAKTAFGNLSVTLGVQAGYDMRRHSCVAICIWVWLLACVTLPVTAAENRDIGTFLETLKVNVVRITATRETGAEHQGFGFVVAETPQKVYVVTANHVVRGQGPDGQSRRITLTFFEQQGTTFAGTLLSTSSNDRDLAVLTAPKPPGFVWRRDAQGAGEPITWGAEVWVIGRHGKWEAPAVAGKITDVNLADQILVDNLPVQPGTSGAPLVARHGIIGMVVSDAPGEVSRALTLTFIRKALQRWQIPWQLTVTGTATSTHAPVPTPPSSTVSRTGTGKLCVTASGWDQETEILVSGNGKTFLMYADDCLQLSPGEYDLSVSDPNAGCRSERVSMEAGKTRDVRLWCTPQGMFLRRR